MIQNKRKQNIQLSTPFNEYFRMLDRADKSTRYTEEYGSFLILSLVEEIGEMARAYLAKHGRKKSNLAAQEDETYEQELGDIVVSILRFARIKNINLHERVMYSLKKIEKRQTEPKKNITSTQWSPAGKPVTPLHTMLGRTPRTESLRLKEPFTHG